MIAFASLTGPLPKAGVVVVALLAALALLASQRRARAAAILGALALSPVLLLADIWSSPQLRTVHDHPLVAVVGAAVGVGVLVAAAVLVARRPAVIAPLAVLALPFRVPIQAGGKTSNLLVPLYLVVAAGSLAWAGSALIGGREARRAAATRRRRAEDLGRHRARDGGAVVAQPARRSAQLLGAGGGRAGLALWVERLLALFVVLYAVQAIYSPDFEAALQNVVFFYVPFALLYGLLREMTWTARMLRTCLALTVGLAVVFSLVGFVEYATKTIILNPRLVVANDLHTYFTVNSVFFDPDIFGRYLALVMILLSVVLLYPRPQREQLTATLVLVVLWSCLVLTLSRSSLGALLVGLAVLAALRFKPSRALVAAAAVIALGAAAIAASPTTFGLNQGVNGASSGRGGLVSGGLSLFAHRPLWGYGSGSFSAEYEAHHRAVGSMLSASHTIPVTIAAEQGLIGELVYAALVACAIVCLVRGARDDPVRSAVAAAFVALIFHTMLYADFLEDPTTWALLAIGVALVGADGAAARGRGAGGAGREAELNASADLGV
ncbi:MAG: O-antigen ligase family protein [Solirubrobacteraceae bacterium]